MVRAGIDIDSPAVKLVVTEDGGVGLHTVADTGSDPLAVCRRLLAGMRFDSITATGYGRHLFKAHWPDATVITEIKAVARGAAREAIARGAHAAVAARTAALAASVSLEDVVVFTGVGARYPVLVMLLGAAPRRTLHLPPELQTVAALGCELASAAPPQIPWEATASS